MSGFDPIHVFVHAEQFRAAGKWLPEAKRQNFPYAVDLAIPVCSAFALELYFKCLLLADGKPIPPDHDLKKLFNKLSQTHKDSIKAHSEIYMSDLRIWFKEECEKTGQPVPTVDFNFVLCASRDAFSAVRYLYENGLRRGKGWIADPIMEGARKRILELHPDWEHARASIRVTMRTLPT